MTDSPDAPAALYAEVAEQSEESPEKALKIGDDNWPAMQARPMNGRDAETCRLLGLTATSLRRFDLTSIWRSRAMIRFAAAGSIDGVAICLIGEALATLSRHNGDYVLRGGTLDVMEPSAAAYGMLEAIEPLTRKDRPEQKNNEEFRDWAPGFDLIARLFWEKRGFFELLEKRYDDARSSYATSATLARPGRGVAKVRGGALLVEYVAAQAGKPHRADIATYIAEQEEVVAAMKAIGDPDLERASAHNLDVMRRGGGDLIPYEIL